MKKIISIFFTFLLSGILIYVGFLVQSNSSYDKPNYSFKEKGIDFFDIKNEKIIFEKSGDLKINYLNIYDKIIDFKGKISIENKNGIENIKLEKGFYLISINSLDKKYNINSNGFEIKTEGTNTFFVDNSSERIKIFSIDSILKINLLSTNSEENEVLNTLFLYPNQYIFFNPNRNNLIKNADLFKIQQITSLGFFSENIIENKKLNKNLRKRILGENKDTNNIEKLFIFIKEEITRKISEIKDFKEKKFFTLPGEDLMIEYDFLVFNKIKKSTYYKNQILKEIQKILKSKENDKLFKETKAKIEDFLEKLKNIDKNGFDEMLEIIKYFSENIVSTEKGKTNLELFFLKLIDEKFTLLVGDENLDLNYIFYNYNFLKNDNFFSEISDFIEKKSNSKLEKIEKNYFVFFLEGIISSNLDKEEINFENTIELFKNFVKNGIEYYSAIDIEDKILSERIKLTGLVKIDKILKKFAEKLEKNFFEKDKNEKLEKIEGKYLDRNFVETLSKNIKNIYENFYTSNQELIKQNSLKESYKKNLESFDKLTLALSDYNKYLIKYDTKLSNIFSKNDSENEEKIKLDKQDALKYLKNFNFIKISEENIEIMGKNYCENPKEKFEKIKINPECYKITDMEIGNGNLINFLLYPNEYNKISNINFSGTNKNFSGAYYLDEEEENFKNGNFTGNNGEDYKFENFFINLVTNSKSTKTKEENSSSEDDIFENNSQLTQIRTIKNTVLLGNKGALTKLKPILETKYENINITENEKNNEEFKIEIIDAKFNYSKNGKKYEGKFNSEYKYNKKSNINKFFNPEIILTSINEKIKISGFLDIADFKSTIENLFKNGEDLIKTVRKIKDLEEGGEVTITYFVKNKKIQILGKNIKIIIKGDEIEDLTSFGKKILEKNEKINKIDELLNNL